VQTKETIVNETNRALASVARGERFDAYQFMRSIGMRVAMRDLFGLDPDEHSAEELAHQFTRGMAFFGTPIYAWALRGPLTPYARMRSARRHLEQLVGEIVNARREKPTRGSATDVLSLLIGSEDTDGSRFTDAELVDHTMTLLFAAHDTSSIVAAMLLYELALHPDITSAIQLELDETTAPGERTRLLSLGLDETLRLYPPVPAGGRLAVEDLHIAGTPIPKGAWVNYCQWATHRLPDVFDDPLQFRPERMAPDRRAFPPGAYAPFGGGSRVCIGKRFGLLEASTIAAIVLRHFRPVVPPGFRPHLRWEGTLKPRRGLPMTLEQR
jgi:cytochrome P450